MVVVARSGRIWEVNCDVFLVRVEMSLISLYGRWFREASLGQDSRLATRLKSFLNLEPGSVPTCCSIKLSLWFAEKEGL